MTGINPCLGQAAVSAGAEHGNPGGQDQSDHDYQTKRVTVSRHPKLADGMGAKIV